MLLGPGPFTFESDAAAELEFLIELLLLKRLLQR